jgi:hypothetical protein
VNRLRSLNWGVGLGSSLRRPATANVLPVYFQQPTYLRRAGTAGQCQFRSLLKGPDPTLVRNWP